MMSKEMKRLFILFYPAVILILLAAVLSSGRVAHAETISIRNIDRVIIDYTAIDEEGDEIDLAKRDGNYCATYGTTVYLHAKADDDDTENDRDLYSQVFLSYQWFYRAKGATDFVALNDINRSNNVVLSITDCNVSGTYYVQITQILHENDAIGYAVGEMVSDPFSIEIEPKHVSIEYTKLETVYNARAQEVEYTVTGEVAGKPAGCKVEYDSSPTNAGEYHVVVYSQNDNYFVEENSAVFVINKAPLKIKVEDVVVLAGYSYTMPITYTGFCGSDNENSLTPPPYISQRNLSYREAGEYQIYPEIPSSDVNYEITAEPGTLHVNRSTLAGDALIGFSGKATGSFSVNATLAISEIEADGVKDSFKIWQSPYAAYTLHLDGESNNDTYTVVIEDVELSGLVKNICFLNTDGEQTTIDSYKYDKNKKTLTLTLSETSGTIVVYHNYLWYIVPGAVVLLLTISLLIFHHRDRNKHKLNRLLSGSAKVEADYYREKIGEYEENESRKV